MSLLTTELIKDTKWDFFGAISVPLYITIFPPLYSHGFPERYGLPFDVLNTYESRKVQWLVKEAQLHALAEMMLPVFMTEQWKYYDRWQEELKPFEKVEAKFMATDLSTLSDAQVRDLMREYRESFAVPFITNNIVEPLSSYFLSHLKALLVAEGLSDERAGELMDTYGQAARPSYLKECAEAYRRAKTEEARAAVLTKYHYIYNDYQGVKAVTDEDLRKLAGTTPYFFASAMTTDGISEKAQALLNVLQITATIQDVRKATFLQMVFASQRFGKEFGKRLNIPYEDMEYATWAEMEDGTLDADELRLRRRPFVLYWTREGVAKFEGDNAVRVLHDVNTFILHTDADAREVKGVCASKGTVQGRAVVVFDTKEFDKVQQGDILITMMTRPEFLPVMHRAAAFVCDEGGLTSHAAIVAREMKKPCIVGTRVGSKIFKDGDMVEVDATAGTVRKI